MARADGSIGGFLKWIAIATALVVVGVTAYEYVHQDSAGGLLHYRLGNQRLEDGLHDQALTEFQAVLAEHPRHAGARLGVALALMGMERDSEALAAFDAALRDKPDFAAAFANRGILLDRLGEHEQALADYRQALRIDPELGEGPDWLTRFLRNQADRPPTIADRANYIEVELKKPPGERVLRIPERDAAQRPYKVEGEL